VRIEKEFVVEMVGETKICVPVYPLEYAEMDDKEMMSGYSEEDDISYDDLDPDLVIDDLED
jgi:spore coat protein E